MRELKNLFFILICVLFSCKGEKEEESQKQLTAFDKMLKRALINGYYEQVDNDMGIAIYQDKMFILSNDRMHVKNNFLLHFLKEDKSFINKDFNFKNGIIKNSEFNLFKNLTIIKKEIPDLDFKSIRIGQYFRDKNGKPSNVWVKKIVKNKIKPSSKKYGNEFREQINLNILDEDFRKSLIVDKFFKNKRGDYILLNDSYIYFIIASNRELKDNFMLHFVKNDNTFINRSFSFKSKSFQNFLETPYSALKIARIEIPYVEDQFLKIRIGQYNHDGNIWAQELIVKEIEENALLKYNNEFLK